MYLRGNMGDCGGQRAIRERKTLHRRKTGEERKKGAKTVIAVKELQICRRGDTKKGGQGDGLLQSSHKQVTQSLLLSHNPPAL